MDNTILTISNALSISKRLLTNKKRIFKHFRRVLITHYNKFQDQFAAIISTASCPASSLNRGTLIWPFTNFG